MQALSLKRAAAVAAHPSSSLKLNKRLARISVLVLSFILSLGLFAWSKQHDRWLSQILDRTRHGRHRDSTFYPYDTTTAFAPVSFPAETVQKLSANDLCASFPHHLMGKHIQPVLKMGHGENREMINAQLNSVSSCFQPADLLIVSDLPETLPNGHEAIDILYNLPQRYRLTNDSPEAVPEPDFAAYEAMHDLYRAGNLTAENDPTRKNKRTGWRLDRYKFLPQVERAWTEKKNKDWYVFYESDTYVSWDNLFRFLSTLDPDRPLYMGSPSPGRRDPKTDEESWFANGGPGYVLSRGAMRVLFEKRASSRESGVWTEEPFLLKHINTVRTDPCGDAILGWVLWLAGIKISGFFPLFNTYALHSLPYTDRLWCQSFVTMHKLSPQDMVRLWRWEFGSRKLGRPLMYADLYEGFFLPEIEEAEQRDNWDNTNWDRLARGRDVYVDSVEKCREACENATSCLQYHWNGKHMRKCVLMPFVTLGHAKQPETIAKKDGGEESFIYTSGWITARIKSWAKAHPCVVPDWVPPSTERHY
ncbi:family 31 putative glycosyltransferase [Triangularia verruculosa]|uniref:N-acetylgalactosaminide beta-1,3-galactosyltransferase n=1 Tax=Triangularia verruculosa TaxID=2587418 RepID=A0AAN6XDR1_9PEZI|nr:family 31 putative glycosyltransferase [Triangularia verruculosa]